MISRRFRNRVNLSGGSAPAIAERIGSLEAGDIGIYRKDLAEVACAGDAFDREIRLAAIAKLDDLETLTKLLEQQPDLARAAADAIGRLLQTGGQQGAQALLESHSVKLAYIRASRDEASIASMLQSLDEDDLAAIACDAAYPGVRRAAAEGVVSESALNDIASRAKNRDKNVFRAAKTRLDRIRAARRTLTEADSRAEDVARRIAELAQLPVDRTFDARVKIIEQEWQECETVRDHSTQACPQLVSEFPQLACSETYGRALKSAKARIATEDIVREETAQATAQAMNAAERRAARPQAERTPARDPVSAPASAPISVEDEQRIQELLQDTPPVFSRPRKIEDYRHIWDQARRLASLQKRLEAFSQRVNASIGEQLGAWLAATKDYSEASEALEHELLERFEAKAEALKSEIELGHLGNATELRRECGDALRMLSQSRARKLWKHLRATDQDMQQLRDWQAYAATPKRESLCERMAEIAEQPLPANEQLDHIRLLREEWKATGPLTGAKDHELRRRFDALADAAYAPCREYFAEQSELRRRNLETRRQICKDIELYIDQRDWRNPDFKAVDQILRTARSEWRNAYPVERTKAKALQKRFDGLCDDLYSRLSSHWKGNEVKARGLIAELRALLESTTAMERLVEGTAAIQARWREVGSMSHAANRKLWREFRGLCDQVYSQRRTVKDKENEAYKDRIGKARELVQRLEEALASREAKSATTSELTQLAGEWESFKDMRGESFKRLDQKWRDLSRRYRQLLREGDAARQTELLELAQRLDGGLCDVEEALVQGETPASEVLEPLSEASANLFGKVPLPRLERVRRAEVTAKDLEQGQAQRRRMCVMLDIYLERESPPEDKALRLEIQVERINRGAGGAQSEQQDPTETARDWCQAGPAGASGKQLSERFFSALQEMME